MRQMLVLWPSLFLAAASFAQNGAGGPFNFFKGRDIDYWGEGRMVRDPLSLSSSSRGPEAASSASPGFSGASVVRGADAKPFSWESYRDPRSPEFWDDGGDWIPPRPFRETAASPTKANVEEYLRWQERKTAVVERFQEALTGASEPKDDRREIPWTSLRLVYFYQTACPHCQKSRALVEELRQRGVRVTAVQLDHKQNPPLHTPSVPYDQDWEREFQVTATPTWILKRGSKTVSRTGELSWSDIVQLTSNLGENKP